MKIWDVIIRVSTFNSAFSIARRIARLVAGYTSIARLYVYRRIKAAHIRAVYEPCGYEVMKRIALYIALEEIATERFHSREICGVTARTRRNDVIDI